VDRIEAVVSTRIPESTQRTRAQKQVMKDTANALGIRLEEDSLLTTSITRREVAQRAGPELNRLAEILSGPELRRRQAETWRIAVGRLVDQALLVQAAIVSPGVWVDDDDVRSQIRRHMTDLKVPDERSLDELLASRGTSLAEMRQDYRVQLLSQRYLDQALKPSPPPGPGEVLKYYAEHIAEFATPQEVQFRQIVLPKADFPTRDAVEARLKELWSLLHNGRDFAELARKHSVSAYAADGGLLPYQPVTSLRPELQDMVRAFSSGRTCTVQETREAFMIVRVDGLRQGQPRASEEVQSEILERMRRNDQEDRRTRELQLLRLRASIRTAAEDAP